MDGWLFEKFIELKKKEDEELFTYGLLTEQELKTRTDLLDELNDNFVDIWYKTNIQGDIDE